MNLKTNNFFLKSCFLFIAIATTAPALYPAEKKLEKQPENKLENKLESKLFDGQSPKWILDYADFLADGGDYYRAISEYKRALFYYPNYDKKDWVRLQIGRMYLLGGRFEQAKDELVTLTDSTDEHLQYYSLNYLAQSYFAAEEYLNANRVFNDLLLKESYREKHNGYLLHIAVGNALEKKYDEAIKTLHQSKEFYGANYPDDIYKQDFATFYQKTEELVVKANSRSEKSPLLAALLGIFPGLGSLYLGKWDNALISLALVASTAYLTYEGYAKDDHVQMGIFASLASGFYVGSIYSGYQGAYRHNATLGENELKEIKSLFRSFQMKVSKNF